MSGSSSSSQDAAAPERPLSEDPVGLTVHAMPAPHAVLDQQRTRRGRLQMFWVLLACAAPVIASYVMYYGVRPDGRTNYATLIQPTRSLPAQLRLLEMDGTMVEPASLRGQWLLVVLGPAACLDGCQKQLIFQRQIHQMLGRERQRMDKLWLVTDEAPVDAALLRGLTDGDDPVRVLRADSRPLASWLAPAEGQSLESHLYLVDPMGEWMMRTPLDPDPQKFKRDLERLLRAARSWDQAGR
jgi:hypothetical protein